MCVTVYPNNDQTIKVGLSLYLSLAFITHFLLCCLGCVFHLSSSLSPEALPSLSAQLLSICLFIKPVSDTSSFTLHKGIYHKCQLPKAGVQAVELDDVVARNQILAPWKNNLYSYQLAISLVSYFLKFVGSLAIYMCMPLLHSAQRDEKRVLNLQELN